MCRGEERPSLVMLTTSSMKASCTSLWRMRRQSIKVFPPVHPVFTLIPAIWSILCGCQHHLTVMRTQSHTAPSPAGFLLKQMEAKKERVPFQMMHAQHMGHVQLHTLPLACFHIYSVEHRTFVRNTWAAPSPVRTRQRNMND